MLQGTPIVNAATHLLVCWTLLLPAQSPRVEPAELELRVQQLSLQLESNDPAQRDAAELRLIELGPDVLPVLPNIDASTAAETKERLTRVRRTLEQRAAQAATQASRVTLEGDYTLSQILAELEKQTGNRVQDFRERFGQQPIEQELSVALDALEFWPALDQVLDQAGMTTYTYGGEPRTLAIVSAAEMPARSGAAAYRGIFRLEATEIQAQRNLRNPGDGSLRIRIEVMWEPRVLPILIRQAYRDLELTANDGSRIAPASQEGVSEVPVQSTVAGVDLILPLQLPARSAESIASLKGQLLAVVPGREETFEFTDLAQARNVSQQKGGLEVTLDRVRQNGAVYEFRMRLRLLGDEATFQSHLDWASGNVIYLEGPGGKRVDNPNFERYLEREREVGYAYLFPLDGDLADYRLVYRSPAAILNVPVDYELKGIRLP